MLQCNVACYSVLQFVEMCSNVLQCINDVQFALHAS